MVPNLSRSPRNVETKSLPAGIAVSETRMTAQSISDFKFAENGVSALVSPGRDVYVSCGTISLVLRTKITESTCSDDTHYSILDDPEGKLISASSPVPASKILGEIEHFLACLEQPRRYYFSEKRSFSCEAADPKAAKAVLARVRRLLAPTLEERVADLTERVVQLETNIGTARRPFGAERSRRRSYQWQHH